jgi:hypothetical protein
MAGYRMQIMNFARISLLAVAALGGVSSLAAADSERGAPSRAARILHFKRPPYAGVRCARGNSIACDRISLAVWPAGQPERLTATIAGRRITMRPPSRSLGRSYWEGTLDHAGVLLPGPLHVIPDRGRFYWSGRHPRPFSLDLFASYRGKRDAAARVRILLRPGWG